MLSLTVCGSCQPLGQCSVSLNCSPITGRPGSTSGSAPITQYSLVFVSKSLCRRSVAPAGALPVMTECDGASAAASALSSSASRPRHQRPPPPRPPLAGARGAPPPPPVAAGGRRGGAGDPPPRRAHL